jgi:hypothetical protein
VQCSLFIVLRVRVEIMGSRKFGTAGRSQSVLIVTNPMILTRARTAATAATCCCRCDLVAEEVVCVGEIAHRVDFQLHLLTPWVLVPPP